MRVQRRERIQDFMRQEGVDHLLLSNFDSIRYTLDARYQMISEGWDWFWAIVDDLGVGETFVPWIDEDLVQDPDTPSVAVAHPLPSWTSPVTQAEYWGDAVSSALRRARAKRVGFDQVDATLLRALESLLPDVAFVPVASQLYALRAVKLPQELRLLEDTGRLSAAAANAALHAGAVGMSDFDVLAVAMNSLQASGVEYITHSLCGIRRLGWFPVGTKLREGDAFFFDIGCYGIGGYASDIARTGFIGEPPAQVMKAYQTLLEAQQVGEESARPGVSVTAVHRAINDYLQRHDLPPTPYGTGHGIGLRACEPPTIHRRDRLSADSALRAGMTISLEPETRVYVDGEPVILKIEDNYVVEPSGLRCISRGETSARPESHADGIRGS